MKSFFKQLRAITPRTEYAQWSKAEILSTPRKMRWYETFAALATPLTARMTLIVGVIATVAAGAILLPRSPQQTAGADFQRTVAEAEESTIEIKMAELQYYTTTKNTLDGALTEAAGATPGQLSPTILQTEQTMASSTAAGNADITAGLNALTQ